MRRSAFSSALSLSLGALALPTILQAQVTVIPSGQTVTGDPDAIEVIGQGIVFNLGTIDGVFNGIEFVNGMSSGAVRNAPTGRILSDSRALNIGGFVTISNQGEILGTGDQRNGTVYSDSVATGYRLLNDGVIDAGQGNQGSGVAFEIGTNTQANVLNTGRIQGRTNTPALPGNVGLSGDGFRLNNFTPANGEVRSYNGFILNSGQIYSESESGTISGFRVAEGIGFQGSFLNLTGGEVFGPNNGVYFGNGDHSGGSFINLTNAEIRSNSRALNIDGVGLTVNNSGQIIGSGNQRNGTVYADATAQNFILNNNFLGVIDAGFGNEGAGFSVELDQAGNEFEIQNSGDLLGRGNAGAGFAAAGDGIRLERTRIDGMLEGSTVGLFTGEINNSGEIRSVDGANGTVSGFRAVNGVSFQGNLTNSGLIAGPQNGVYFGNPVPAGGSDHTGGVVENRPTGVFSSDSRAFNLDGNGLSVFNRGQILATGTQRNGTFYADGTADNFVLLNEGSISALAAAGSGVSIQVGSFDGDVQTATITNSGEIFGEGLLDVDAGVRLFTSSLSSTFSGDIRNLVGGMISGGENAPGVLIQDGVAFDGTVLNDGTIDGGVDMSTGNLTLSDSSVIRLEIGGMADGQFEQILVGGDLVIDGTLVIDFVDGYNAPVDNFARTFGQSFLTVVDGAVSGQFDQVIVNGFVLFP